MESPTKQKTIAKFLGSGYTIMATYGHIRDLPSRSLGVDEKKDFEPQYVILPKAKKVMPALKEAVQNAAHVYLATDFDREGEAIAWHVAEALKVPADRMSRITFHEITETAIKESLDHARDIDMTLVHAQQARRVLDRLVGYKTVLAVVGQSPQRAFRRTRAVGGAQAFGGTRTGNRRV